MWKKTKKYSEHYRECCEAIEKFTAEKLGRALSTKEKQTVWNSGSVMQLEVIDRHLYEAKDAIQTEAQLEIFSESSEQRFASDYNYLIDYLEKLLNRKISEDEKSKIQRSESVKDLMEIGEQIKDAREAKREVRFRQVLANKFAQ